MIKQITPETFTSLVLWSTVLLGVIAVAMILLTKLRGNTQRNEDSAGELLSNLQELRQEGDISDAEYRTIKSVLGGKLPQRVKDDQDKA